MALHSEAFELRRGGRLIPPDCRDWSLVGDRFAGVFTEKHPLTCTLETHHLSIYRGPRRQGSTHARLDTRDARNEQHVAAEERVGNLEVVVVSRLMDGEQPLVAVGVCDQVFVAPD